MRPYRLLSHAAMGKHGPVTARNVSVIKKARDKNSPLHGLVHLNLYFMKQHKTHDAVIPYLETGISSSFNLINFF